MKKLIRDTEPLPTIRRLMPDASFEEQMRASATVWQLFDSLWDLAEKLVREDKAKAQSDEKLPTSDTIEESTNA